MGRERGLYINNRIAGGRRESGDMKSSKWSMKI